MADGLSRRLKLEAELERLLPLLIARGVEAVILFGSLVAGDPGSASDLDLIVVEHTEQPFFRRIEAIREVIQPLVALDLLVYTPQELETMEKTSSFVRKALSQGRTLYEKQQ